MPLTGFEIASLVVALIGTGSSIQQGKKASKAQKASSDLQQRQADISSYRERIQQVREARARRAEVQQQAQLQGVAGSSSATGAVSSIGSQQAANLSFLDQTQQLSRGASIFNQQAATAQSKAATASAIGGIGQSIFESQDGWKKLFQ